MKHFYDILKNNVLIKVGSLNSLGVFVKMISGIVTSKIVALFLGAEGMALIGNLRNVLTSIQAIGTLGLYNGVVKYIAEHKTDKEELIKLLSTSYFLCYVVVFALAGWLYFDPMFWNDMVFGKEYSFGYVFEALAIALPFYGANTLCLAIINGFSKYRIYIILNITSSIVGLFTTVILIWQFSLDGAFIAVVLNPAISLLITLVLIMQERSFVKLLWANRISLKYIKWFSSYSVMALISATLLPAVMIKIRNFIIATESVDKAGYWEAMQRISGQYMVFVSTLLTIYLLPKFSEIKSTRAFRSEVLNFYKIVLPIFGLGLIMIYFLKGFIIEVLLSKDFAPMEPLFQWQLLGDFFKVMALVIGYQLLAKKMFWYYLITEVASIAFLYFSSLFLVKEYGFVGAAMAHCFNYILLFIGLLFIFRNSFLGPDTSI